MIGRRRHRKQRSRGARAWEVKVGGSWRPAIWGGASGGQRPRVGGLLASPYRVFGRIEDVRRAR